MRHLKKALIRILKTIQLVESVCCFVGLSVSTLLVTAQVFNRYWLHFEIMWFSDLALYSYLMFMFIAATLATWQESHVAVDFFRDSLLKGIASTFVPVTFQIMEKALQYPEYGTLVPWFNTSWIRIILTVSYSLVVLHLLVIARRDISDLIMFYRSRSRR